MCSASLELLRAGTRHPADRRSAQDAPTVESGGLPPGRRSPSCSASEPQAAVQPPLHRHGRDAEHLGGLGLRHPLDAHQVEHLPLVLRQLVDRLAACGGRPG